MSNTIKLRPSIRFDEYMEFILFTKLYAARIIDHNLEMGLTAEKILLNELEERFKNLLFVRGFIDSDNNSINEQQCDIIVCKKDSHIRNLENQNCIVSSEDCLMVIEVKSNITLEDFRVTEEKNKIFKADKELKDVIFCIFAFNTKIGKKATYELFGYRYNSMIKAYENIGLKKHINVDCFISIHRANLGIDCSKEKQIFIIKDEQNNGKYLLHTDTPVTNKFFNYINSLSK